MTPSAIDNATAYKRSWRRKHAYLAVLCLLLVGFVIADTLLGPAPIGLGDLWRALWGHEPATVTDVIVWQLRLPQALMALAVGAALGLAGAEMQTVLNNPLASPFTLGISSAAALGAALTLVFHIELPFIAANYSLAFNAFALALLCAWLLDLIARKAGIGTTGIVLFGIALVFTFNALLSLAQFMASANALQDLVFWMMGSLARTDWSRLALMGAVLVVVAPFSMGSAWKLTALRFGEERATSFGIDARRVRRAALLRISALAALAVALVGVIGFIGLIAPHMARRIWGEDHRWYLPASALIGSAILCGASIASKLLSSDAVLPVGIVTTLVGIPFYLVTLLRQRVAQ